MKFNFGHTGRISTMDEISDKVEKLLHEERLFDFVMVLYMNTNSIVKALVGSSNECEIGVEVSKGSALIFLRDLCELLYTDYLVLTMEKGRPLSCLMNGIDS